MAIYAEWKDSVHGRSVHTPAFRAALEYALNKGKPASFCLDCHAPLTRFAGNAGETARKILDGRLDDVEGVACDLCHSVEKVHPGSLEPTVKVSLIADPKVKVGGVADPIAGHFHGSRYSPLLGRSEFCYACHEYREGAGTTGGHSGRTYSEWKSSVFAGEGRACQDCHMPRVMRPLVEGGPVRRSRSHRFPGPRSDAGEPGSLDAAVRLGIAGSRRGNTMELRVRIENVGSPHTFPNLKGCPGCPFGEKLLLRVSALADHEPFLDAHRVIQIPPLRGRKGGPAGPGVFSADGRVCEERFGAELPAGAERVTVRAWMVYVFPGRIEKSFARTEATFDLR